MAPKAGRGSFWYRRRSSSKKARGWRNGATLGSEPVEDGGGERCVEETLNGAGLEDEAAPVLVAETRRRAARRLEPGEERVELSRVLLAAQEESNCRIDLGGQAAIKAERAHSLEEGLEVLHAQGRLPLENLREGDDRFAVNEGGGNGGRELAEEEEEERLEGGQEKASKKVLLGGERVLGKGRKGDFGPWRGASGRRIGGMREKGPLRGGLR